GLEKYRNGAGPLGALLILILMMVLFRGLDRAPVDLIPASAPTEVFSGERAKAVMNHLLQENRPHPVGSALNQVVRGRIQARLAELGLESEIQKNFKCSGVSPSCAFVENIIAVKKGTDTSVNAKAILLTAHYESAPTSVGAGDDITGVAAMLEIAANLHVMPALKNDIIFLFADAEETGLNGATAFAEDSPLMTKVGLVLNMEARGVAGPSVMFETGPNNLNQVAGFKEGAATPIGSSLMVEVYKRMPNGTDYMIYGQSGVPGLNFAFSQGVALYHSQLDDPAHIDDLSIQHHGDNLLAMVQVFGNKDLNALPAGEDATYIDLFGTYLVSWPSSMGPWLAGLAMVGLFLTARTQAGFTLRQVPWALGTVVVVIIALPALGWLVSFPLGQMGAIAPLEHPAPWPGRITLVALAILVGGVGGSLAARKAGVLSLFSFVWGLYGLAGLALTFVVPGISFLFLLPALVAGVVGGVMSFSAKEKALKWACYAGLLMSTYIAIYKMILMGTVFNFEASHFRMIVLMLLALPLLPVVSLWRGEAVAILRPALFGVAGAALAGIVGGMLVSGYTAERPRSLNIVYHSNEITGDYQYQVVAYGKQDKSYLAAAGFPEGKKSYLQFGAAPGKGYFIPAEDMNLASPNVVIISDTEEEGRRVIKGTIHAGRAAQMMGFGFVDGRILHRMTVNGQQVVLREGAVGSPRIIWLHGAGDTYVPFSMELTPGEIMGLSLFSLGPLPETAQAKKLQDLRPNDAAPMHYGDHSLVITAFSGK
ncbi:MAG: M28 family peptidase, partial [Kordiimonadaceae bacterium]|nr:M28 family peptidase [Kordiimonadaceae bacterium]